MSLKIYNVLTKKLEEFKPINDDEVKMYACGITASGDAHIGHAFQAIVFDMIKNYLSFSGYNVKYVRNYTDVDDKIILRATSEKRDYGEPISLILSYNCPVTVTMFNDSLFPVLDTKNLEVKVSKYSFSKR